MTSLTLPTPADSFHLSAGVRLLKQGIMLNIATVAGPLDVFRKKGQRIKALKLFFTEYGLNLLLFGLLQLVIILYMSDRIILGEILAVGFIFSMSVIQMLVDSLRTPIQVYHSSRYEAGISVRLAGDKCWAFFNHYALPVGRKHGVHLRSELHKQAKDTGNLLFCYAQNDDIAAYYLREHPDKCILTPAKKGSRPLLVWDYRAEGHRNGFTPHEKKKPFDLFGFNSARNSGSIPLL